MTCHRARRPLPAAVLLFAVALAAAAPARGHGAADEGEPRFDERAALGLSRAAIGRKIGAYRLCDGDGRAVDLAELRGRPLVVSMVYTSCAQSCPVVTETLARAVEVARDALGGQSFRVATIGFDSAVDSPERMRLFARERGIDMDGWLFLSTDAPTLSDLARDLGFVHYRSAKGFDHIDQVTLLDPAGRVVRQIYGNSFEPPALVEPLRAIALAQPLELQDLAGLIERVRLFCTVYDPAKDRYRLDYSVIVAFAAGVASLGAVGVFLLRAWRQNGPGWPAR